MRVMIETNEQKLNAESRILILDATIILALGDTASSAASRFWY